MDDPWHIGELPGDDARTIRDQNGLTVQVGETSAHAKMIMARHNEDPAIVARLAQDDRRMLVVSPLHLTWETCMDAERKAISWANVIPTDVGFICYCHDERCTLTAEGEADELWAVMQFARRYGYDYIMVDGDAEPFPPEAGLAEYEHPDADVWDNTQAVAEGWFLDAEAAAIQRDDSSDVLPQGSPFATDDDAVAFVKRRASEGSAYHSDAMSILGERF